MLTIDREIRVRCHSKCHISFSISTKEIELNQNGGSCTTHTSLIYIWNRHKIFFSLSIVQMWMLDGLLLYTTLVSGNHPTIFFIFHLYSLDAAIVDSIVRFLFYLAGLVMMNDPFVSFARARTSITHSSRSSSKAVWNLEVPCHQCSVSARHTQKESGGSPIVLRDLYRPKSTHYNQARTVRRQEHARENGHKKMGGSVLTDDIRPLFLLSRGWLNKSIISSSLFDWL